MRLPSSSSSSEGVHHTITESFAQLSKFFFSFFLGHCSDPGCVLPVDIMANLCYFARLASMMGGSVLDRCCSWWKSIPASR